MGGRGTPGAPKLLASMLARPCRPDAELDLQRSVQAVLRELGAQAPALQSNQGKSQQAASATISPNHLPNPPGEPNSPRPSAPARLPETWPRAQTYKHRRSLSHRHTAVSPWCPSACLSALRAPCPQISAEQNSTGEKSSHAAPEPDAQLRGQTRGCSESRSGAPGRRVPLRGSPAKSPLPHLRVPGSPFSRPGMWRWSLHKKVERDPGKSPALVRILLRELEKVGSGASGRRAGVGERERESPSQLGPRGHQSRVPQTPVTCGLSA